MAEEFHLSFESPIHNETKKQPAHKFSQYTNYFVCCCNMFPKLLVKPAKSPMKPSVATVDPTPRKV